MSESCDRIVELPLQTCIRSHFHPIGTDRVVAVAFFLCGGCSSRGVHHTTNRKNGKDWSARRRHQGRAFHPPAVVITKVWVPLKELMRTPAGVVRQVKGLLVLFMAAVEASLPSSGTPSPVASIAGRAVATAARGSVVITEEKRQEGGKIITRAKARRVTGERFMREKREGDKTVEKGTPKSMVQTLRSWAVQRPRKVQRLLRLPQATPHIEIDDALLMRHHPEGVVPHDAGTVNGYYDCIV